MNVRHGFTWLALVILVVIAVAVACTGDEPPPPVAPPSVEAAPTTSPTAAPTEAPPSPTPPPVESGVASLSAPSVIVRTWPAGDGFILGRLRGSAEPTIAGRTEDGEWLAIEGVGWIRNQPGVTVDPPANRLRVVGVDFVFGPTHPPDVRTFIDSVDRVIDLVAAADATGLLALAALEEVACRAEPTEPGTPPQCAEGVPAGTIVRALSVSACDGELTPEEQLPAHFERFVASPNFDEPPRLYAVFRLDPAVGPGRYDVLFAFPDGVRARRITLGGRGRILRTGNGCEPVGYAIGARLARASVNNLEFGPAVPAGLLGPVDRLLPFDITSSAARITTNNLNVRLQKRLESLVLGQLNEGDTVTVVGRSPDREWLALKGLGWVFYDPEWIDLDEPWRRIVVTSQLALAPHPLDRRSGIPAVDRVLDLVTSRDLDGLRALATLSTLPCRTEDYGPFCPEGVAEGTPIQVFGTARCQGIFYTDAARIDAEFDLFGQPWGGEPDAPAPFAVYRLDDGRYGIALAFEDGQGRVIHVDRDGGIVHLSAGCGATPIGSMFPANADFVMGPPVPEILTPVR